MLSALLTSIAHLVHDLVTNAPSPPRPPPPPLLMTTEQLYPRQVPMEPRPPLRALPDTAPQIARDGLLHVWDNELPQNLV